MKKSMYLLAGVLAVSLLGACGPVQKKASAGEEGQVVFACMDSTTMERGGVKLTWIKDNAKERLMPLSLFGDVPKALVDRLGIADGIPSSISCFLMEADGKYILFDTGNGASDSRLMDGLASVGVSPSDIDYLYLTHFHGDHIGGMMKGDSVAFSQAEVYAARQEYEGWMQMPDEQKAQVVRTMEAYKDRLPELWRRRAEHYYSEFARAEKGAELWRKGDLEGYGQLVFESGKSSIYSYECGCDELKKLYEIMADTDGIYGGRFSGAGFKGCCMALIDPDKAEDIEAKVTAEYLKAFPALEGKYSFHLCESADGVEL